MLMLNLKHLEAPYGETVWDKKCSPRPQHSFAQSFVQKMKIEQTML